MYDWIPYKYKMIEYKTNDDWVIIEKIDFIEI